MRPIAILLCIIIFKNQGWLAHVSKIHVCFLDTADSNFVLLSQFFPENDISNYNYQIVKAHLSTLIVN